MFLYAQKLMCLQHGCIRVDCAEPDILKGCKESVGMQHCSALCHGCDVMYLVLAY